MSEEEETLAAAARRVGTVLHGKYQLDRVLGVGGMATVYAATHRNRKRFAVKMLHPEYSVRRDVRARFVREGYVANSVNHPGVVVVIDDDVDETGAAFLVMELLDGVTVDALQASESGPLPVRESLGVALQLLDVLHAAHEKSVIHRDIKPANVFVMKDGQIKVVDFGIARLRDADAGLQSTRTGATLGTPAFMAPEQARAVPGDIDARTDVWAVGATLFTMLSARFVHDGENSRQIMISAATEPARSITTVVPDLPGPIVELVTRALAFERAERFPSAEAMRDRALQVHRDLFGEPSPAPLAALVQRAKEKVGNLPTEPVPEGTSSVVAPLVTSGDGASLLGAAHGALSTTSRPVSTSSGATAGRTRLTLAGVGVVALGGVIWSVAPWDRTTNGGPAPAVPSPNVMTSGAPPEATPPTLGPSPEAATTAQAPAPTGSATAPSRSAEPAARPSPLRSAALPSARATASVPLRTTAAPDTSSSPTPRSGNPLELKLQ